MLPSVIEYGLLQSFLSNPDAAYELLSTGNEPIVIRNEDYSGLSESLTVLRQLLYDACEGDISQYKSGKHWVVDKITSGGRWMHLYEDAASKGQNAPSVSLYKYMVEERRITPAVLRHYCYQLKVHSEMQDGDNIVTGNPVYAVGFLNCQGGFELRKEDYIENDVRKPGLKACTTKAISIITADGNRVIVSDNPLSYEGYNNVMLVPSLEDYVKIKKASCCWIFEGFSDFLSSLSWMKRVEPKVDCIILNSISEARVVSELLASYDKVVSFLDLDKAGRDTTGLLKSLIASRNQYTVFVDGMEGQPEFKGYKDVNEAWQAHCSSKEENVNANVHCVSETSNDTDESMEIS